jgi:hypothetical protein
LGRVVAVYIPGRRLTGSSPVKTSISLAWYWLVMSRSSKAARVKEGGSEPCAMFAGLHREFKA